MYMKHSLCISCHRLNEIHVLCVWFTQQKQRLWKTECPVRDFVARFRNFLLTEQKKFSGRTKTFLSEIILSERNIIAGKGQTYKETSVRFHSFLASVKDACLASSIRKALSVESMKMD